MIACAYLQLTIKNLLDRLDQPLNNGLTEGALLGQASEAICEWFLRESSDVRDVGV